MQDEHIVVSRVEAGTDPLSSLLGTSTLEDTDFSEQHSTKPTIDVAKLASFTAATNTSSSSLPNLFGSEGFFENENLFGSESAKGETLEETVEISKQLGVALSSSPTTFSNTSFLIDNKKKNSNDNHQEQQEDEEDVVINEERPRPSLSEIKADFMALFSPKFPEDKDKPINLEALTTKALSCHLAHICVRGIVWRVFLGAVLDRRVLAWPEEIRESRREYEALQKRYIVDPHSAEKELDPTIHNPLSDSEQSPWQQFFQDTELKKQIQLDLRRVYPEIGFFKQSLVQDQMLRILFIYAREHPRTLYKQGMHELLAPILYVLHRESIRSDVRQQVQVEEGESDYVQVLFELSDADYVEHDAFTLFNMLMEHTYTWFISSERPQPVEKKSEKIESEPFAKNAIPDSVMSSPIIQKCRRIQQELLRRTDPQLCQYLNSVQIEPQLYALRWLRLLLGREFHLDDLLIIWDAIFAYGKGLILVDYIIVAMLVFIREQLIGKDFTACMQRLFKYPPVEDVTIFVFRALDIINPKARVRAQSEIINSPTATATATTATTNHPIINSSSLSPLSSAASAAAAVPSHSFTSPLLSSPLLSSPTLSSSTSTALVNGFPQFESSPLSVNSGNNADEISSFLFNSSDSSNSVSTPGAASSSSFSSNEISDPLLNPGGGSSSQKQRKSATIPGTSSSSASSSKKKSSSSSHLKSPGADLKSFTSTLKQLISEPKSKTVSREAKQQQHQQQVTELTARIKNLQKTQLHMSNRLERIIYTLQNEVVDKKESMTAEERYDAVLLAVAELKQVRDVLAGDLPYEAKGKKKDHAPIPSHPASHSSQSPHSPSMPRDI